MGMPTTYPAPRKSNRSATLKLLLIELAFLIAIAVPIILVLAYFRVIPLSFLPQKPLVSEKQKQEVKQYVEQPLQFVCPIEASLCKTGKQLYDIKNRTFDGFAYDNLPSETKIVAVFDGTFTVTKSKEGNADVTTISLIATDKSNEILYRFKGTPATDKLTGAVKQKDVIGTTSGGVAPLTDFNTAEYSLYVRVKNVITSQSLPFKPSTDGKGLAM